VCKIVLKHTIDINYDVLQNIVTLTEVFHTLTEVFLNLTEVFLTLTEVFFLSCKANARVKNTKTGHGPHPSACCYLCYCCYLCRSMYCLCVNVYCQRVTTQLQLLHIS
jgi:hypothetical protein